jgi:hypothetical protein
MVRGSAIPETKRSIDERLVRLASPTMVPVIVGPPPKLEPVTLNVTAFAELPTKIKLMVAARTAPMRPIFM